MVVYFLFVSGVVDKQKPINVTIRSRWVPASYQIPFAYICHGFDGGIQFIIGEHTSVVSAAKVRPEGFPMAGTTAR